VISYLFLTKIISLGYQIISLGKLLLVAAISVMVFKTLKINDA